MINIKCTGIYVIVEILLIGRPKYQTKLTRGPPLDYWAMLFISKQLCLCFRKAY